MLKIIDIRATAVTVPLLYAFKAAYGTRDTADFTIVEVEDNEGRVGYGEASTIPIYDEGSQAGSIYVLNKYIKPLLLGLDPRDINGINNTMAAAVKGERYLKTAIDFALHDLVAKAYDISVCQFLGGTIRPIKVCWVLSANSPEKVKEEAAQKIKEGYTVFKLKVGTNRKSDLVNLKALRDTVDMYEIRLDGNEAWGPKEALQRIQEFAPYFPDHIEQPVPAWDIKGLSFVRKNSPIPIVADEVVRTFREAMSVAQADAGDRVNIKISRCGGYNEARKMAAIAEAAGQLPFLGSMLELGLGTIATAHFAAAFPGMKLATELVGPLLLKRDILKIPLIYKDGHLLLHEGPGFGIEIDRDVLKEFTVRD